jgi:murein DD-endopeptidase MepM/ murein hydrolase activator NlpD
MRRFSFVVTLVVLATVACRPSGPIPEGKISLRANPVKVCLPDRHPQYPNFDLLITNGASREIEVRKVSAAVLQGAEVIEQRQVAAQGAEMLGPGKTISASSEGMLYNPFLFNSLKPGVRIRYEIEFEGEGVPPVSVTVAPEPCFNKTRLVLPVTGRVAVGDGFDLYSHHRRRQYQDSFWKSIGVFDHPDRFGLDLMLVDAQGRQFEGSGKRNKDFFAWGQPLRAPADGIVVSVDNTQKDNTVIGTENLWRPADVETEPMQGFGNHVLINHGEGEFSLLAHARAGSVIVRKGDRVRAGQVVAQVGNSGSSLGPHLHYELRTGWGLKGITGLPAYFHDVTVVGTGETGNGRGVALDSGDVVIAR